MSYLLSMWTIAIYVDPAIRACLVELSQVAANGFGNAVDISNKVPTKPPKENG